MTGETRQKALDKLHAFTPHIGYPDKWHDYSDLSIRRDDLIGDVSRSDAFEWHYRIDRIDAARGPRRVESDRSDSERQL